MTRYDREPMTPLRRRYIADLRLRNKSPRTIETYVLRVALFAKHFGRSPADLGPGEIRAYQEDLLQRRVYTPTAVRPRENTRTPSAALNLIFRPVTFRV